MRIAYTGLRSIGDCAGGIESHVEQLAIRMARLGHEVTIFCRARYNPSRHCQYQGVKLINLPAIYSKHLESISHTALSIPLALTGFDIIHFHALGPSLLSWLPRLFGRKVVVTVHGLDFMRAKWGRVASMILNCGAWTAANCPHQTIVVSKVLQNYYKAIHGKRTIHIPNGVNPPVIRPPRNIKRFGLDTKNYILFLGRLVPEKGAHHLIRAFMGIDSTLKLAIVGGATHTDKYCEELRRMADTDKRIIFTGPFYGDDKCEVLSNAKVFVLPSELEGMPIVLLEAMSYGCSVLASNIPECVEVTEGGGSMQGKISGADQGLCRMFEAGNVKSLQSQLAAMLESTGLNEMGARAREYVTTNYDWDSITKKTIRIYESILKN